MPESIRYGKYGQMNHTPEPWGFFIDKTLNTHEKMSNYQKECISKGGNEFFYVGIEKADICHTGNGPHSEANARHIVKFYKACAGIKNPETTIPKMVEALKYSEEADTGNPDAVAVFRKLREEVLKLAKEQ